MPVKLMTPESIKAVVVDDRIHWVLAFEPLHIDYDKRLEMGHSMFKEFRSAKS